MQIKKLKIEDIVPYGNNAKEHPQEQIEQLKNSIKEFGNNDPIAIDENNVIIEGHGRLMALQELGFEEAECIVLEGLTEEQKNAYRLVHNQLTMNTGWNTEMLKAELDKINLNMAEFGLDESLLDELETPAEEDDFNVEEALEEIEEPQTKPGDLYKLGEHLLLCGDSTKKQDVQKVMQGEHADLFLTDPPYNVDYEGKAGKIKNDNMTDIHFYEFLKDAFVAANESLKEGGAFYIWHADSEGLNFRQSCNSIGWKVRQCLIWVKNALVMGRQDYQWKHEPCLYGWKEGAGHYFIEDRTQTTVFEEKLDLDAMKKEELRQLVDELLKERKNTTILHEDKPIKNDLHPTMKPIKLLSKLIINSSRKNELVLDTFGGSGSTLIACEQLKRKCRMIELDPKYCDVIIQRWETLTGQTAELIQQEG